MRFTLTLTLLSALSGLLTATPVPKGTDSAAIQIPNSDQLRIYHQDNTSGSGIKEISVKLPAQTQFNDGLIFGGSTRAGTPLAAVSWVSTLGNGDPEVSTVSTS